MRKRIFRIIFVVAILWAIGFGIYAGISIALNSPPTTEIQQAREALHEAKTLNAESLAPESYKKARLSYDKTMSQWKTENLKPIYQRRYSKIESGALESEKFAKQSIEQAFKRSEHLKKTLSTDIKKLKVQQEEVNRTTRLMPLPKKILRASHQSQILISEAEKLLEQKNYSSSSLKLERARKYIDETRSFSQNLLKDYFENYGKWMRWYDETIEYSRQNQSRVIVVDKFANNCMVFNNGKLEYSFESDFGKMWIGEKSSRGDMATPEGRYKITDKKDGRRTKYYKALLINYPNQDDIARLKKTKNRAEMGSLIEIHGGGGTGVNWTEGCVAVSNSDMDKLFSRVSVGTPVTIVGSLAPYSEVYSKIFKK
jgi:L,D-peptidoglycan transpeptidase YkuD (ErfK/YbiS/YcfS/YnhG family)